MTFCHPVHSFGIEEHNFKQNFDRHDNIHKAGNLSNQEVPYILTQTIKIVCIQIAEEYVKNTFENLLNHKTLSANQTNIQEEFFGVL